MVLMPSISASPPSRCENSVLLLQRKDFMQELSDARCILLLVAQAISPTITYPSQFAGLTFIARIFGYFPRRITCWFTFLNTTCIIQCRVSYHNGLLKASIRWAHTFGLLRFLLIHQILAYYSRIMNHEYGTFIGRRRKKNKTQQESKIAHSTTHNVCLLQLIEQVNLQCSRSNKPNTRKTDHTFSI